MGRRERQTAAVGLASSVVSGVFQVWAGPFSGAVDSAVELIRSRVEDRLEQRRLERFVEDCVDTVAAQIIAATDTRTSRLPENEVVAAIDAVKDTFDIAEFSVRKTIDADLEPALIRQMLAPYRDTVLRRAELSDRAVHLYTRLLQECSSYVVQVVTSLPEFQTTAFTEVLRRQSIILDSLNQMLERLPELRGINDFETDYRRHIVTHFDRMELFGLDTAREVNKRYPLNVAYVSLGAAYRTSANIGFGSTSVSSAQPLLPEDRAPSSATPPDSRAVRSATAGDTHIEDILHDQRRLFLIGEAGSGKTTVLQWLAVQSARRGFDGKMGSWNECIPFFVRLRHFAGKTLPRADELPAAVAPNIAGEISPTWVTQSLRSGTGLVLVDGIDELPAGRPREDARAWLRGLLVSFPQARYVVTSRPTAVAIDWLQYEGFAPAELEPMTPSGIREFIGQWHEAIRSETGDPLDRERIDGDREALLTVLESDRSLRSLCVNPLLCALLCALNRERHRQLPRNRKNIYQAAIQMLLERRDRERGVEAGGALSYESRLVILQELALYFMRNSWAEAPRHRAEEQISRSLRHVGGAASEAQQVLQLLLERSGLLRCPAMDRIDFVHRSFQEYLAGKAAADNDEIGFLADKAGDDQWFTTITMAAGHANSRQRTELFKTLLAMSSAWPPTGINPDRVKIVLVGCLQTAAQIDPDLRGAIENVTRDLIPPKSVDLAPALAAAGSIVFEALRDLPPRTADEAVASIRLASLIGGDSAMEVIAEIAAMHEGITAEVVRAWSFFPPEEYARKVLAVSRSGGQITLTDLTLLTHLRWFTKLSDLTIDSKSFSECDGLPPSPPELEKFVIAGGYLESIAGIESWPQLRCLDLDFGPHPPDLGPLAALPELELLCVRTSHKNVLDLSPLTHSRSLRVVHLDQPHAAHFQLRPLPRNGGLEVLLPPNVAAHAKGVPKESFKISRITIGKRLW